MIESPLLLIAAQTVAVHEMPVSEVAPVSVVVCQSAPCDLSTSPALLTAKQVAADAQEIADSGKSLTLVTLAPPVRGLNATTSPSESVATHRLADEQSIAFSRWSEPPDGGAEPDLRGRSGGWRCARRSLG